MIVLIFDTETNGLPKGYNISVHETDKWPYILQLSYILYDISENNLMEMNDFIIKSKGKINESAYKINGINESLCKRKGVDITIALESFNNALKSCDVVVAHNLSFDKNMYLAECIRNNIEHVFINKNEYCTMLNSIKLCKIVRVNKLGRSYYKYPKMIELYEYLFNDKNIKNLHNSMADILVCFKCYYFMIYNKDIYKICNKKLKNIFELYCY
jgi:DNA polymerase III epsilon subunit-like protein